MDTKMIGSKIASARKSANISQAQLAQRLFISPQAVGKWERGESSPDIITISRLAEILGVDLNYFSENFPSAVVRSEALATNATPDPKAQIASKNTRLSWDMSGGNWVDADFSGLKELHEKFSLSNMQRCKFIGSDLSGLLLKGNNVNGCDFSGSDFSSSHIQRSYLSNNQFRDSSLKDAAFTESYISTCDFSGADFSGAVFKTGGIEKCNTTNAVWNRTSFIMAQLADIVFTGSVADCYFENCAFTWVIFQDAVITNTFFKNKSLKNIRFIDCKADKMTYEFLKNGKANLSGIELITA